MPKAAAHPITILEYDRLFLDANPAREEDFFQFLNPNSLKECTAYAEPSLANATEGEVFQFERLGYYAVNKVDNGKASTFHRVVNLRDSWGA